MNSVNGKMGTFRGDAADPLQFAFGLPWWARRYGSLSDEEKVKLAKAVENNVIFGYDFYLKGELG